MAKHASSYSRNLKSFWGSGILLEIMDEPGSLDDSRHHIQALVAKWRKHGGAIKAEAEIAKAIPIEEVDDRRIIRCEFDQS